MRLIFKLKYPKKEDVLKYLCNYRKYYGLKHFYLVYPELKNKKDIEIAKFFNKNKEMILKKLEIRKKQIEKNWNKMNDSYFKKIEIITKFKWRKENYYCYLSPLDIGEYNPIKRNIIIVFAFNHPKYINQIIAEELYHLHYWNYLENEFDLDVKKEWGKKKQWRLSEAVAMLILEELGFKCGGNYWDKKVNKLYWKLRPFWENKESFKDFISKSLKIKNYLQGHGGQGQGPRQPT